MNSKDGKAASKGKGTAPARSGKGATPGRKPTGPIARPEPDAVEQDVARIRSLDDLYRPLREASESDLAKTKSGQKLLDETRAFGTELAELYQGIASGRTPYEEGERLAQRRRDEFSERYGGELLGAYARHARLQPSVEALIEILRPDTAPQTVWLAEMAPFRATLLQPKAVLEDLGTARQGVGDPAPPPRVHSCIHPPYTRREDYATSPPFGSAIANADLDGNIGIWGLCGSGAAVPEAAIATAWVGHDFSVPSGVTSYVATVDYWFGFHGWAYAVLGISVVNLNVAILIDKGDDTPLEKSVREVHFMVVPFAWGNQFTRFSNVKVQLPPFERAKSEAGTVRVLVGVDGHCMALGLSAVAKFNGVVEVQKICVTSTV